MQSAKPAGGCRFRPATGLLGPQHHPKLLSRRSQVTVVHAAAGNDRVLLNDFVSWSLSQKIKFGGAYRAVLPKNVDLPCLWIEEEIALLGNPILIKSISSEKAEWTSLLNRLEPGMAQQGISRELITWAFSIVRSRSFEAPYFSLPLTLKLGLAVALPLVTLVSTGGQLLPAVLTLAIPAGLSAWDLQQAQSKVVYAVVPFLDMLNHSSSVKTEVGYDWTKEAFTVVSSESYAPGQEVFISYAELSNDALLQRYGFVEAGNTHDRYVVADPVKWLVTGPLLSALAGSSSEGAQLRALINKASPAIRQEVTVQRGGLPDGFVSAVKQLSRQAGGGDALAQAALKHVVACELESLGGSLQQEQQEMQRWTGVLTLLASPEPSSPAAPTAPVPPEAPQEPEHDAGNSSSSNDTVDAIASDIAAFMSVDGTERDAGVAASGARQPSTAVLSAYDQAVEVYQQQLVQYQAACEVHQEQLRRYVEELSAYEEQHKAWREAVELGELAARRRLTACMYRLEKKKLLTECMQRL